MSVTFWIQLFSIVLAGAIVIIGEEPGSAAYRIELCASDSTA